MTSEEPKKDPPTAAEEAAMKKEEDEKPTVENEGEVLKSVAERLKFFFSDANVRQDFFLRKYLIVQEGALVGDKSISAGAVPIDALLRFNTIKQHTTDPAVVIKAVNTLLSDKLVMKDSDKSVARVSPFTRELMNDNIPVTLYVKNIPTKEVVNQHNGKKQLQYDVAMDEIRKLFDTYGGVALVKLRYKRSASSDDDHHTDDIKMDSSPEKGGRNNQPKRRYPMGDCLIEFEEKEGMEKAAEDVLTSKEGEAVEPKRKLTLGDKTLEVMTLKAYMDSLKKRKRDRDTAKEGEDKEDDEISNFTIDWTPGTVLALKGLPEACDREAIIDAVVKGCDLTKDEIKEKKIYADYSRGQKDGAVRFPDVDLTKQLLEKLKSGDVKICDTEMKEVEIMEGDKEKKYWDDFIQFKKQQMRHRAEERKQKKRRKGGRGRSY